MLKEEIVAGIKNAIERGYSLRQAKQSFLIAGYSPEEVEEAAEFLQSGYSTAQTERPAQMPTVQPTNIARPPRPKPVSKTQYQQSEQHTPQQSMVQGISSQLQQTSSQYQAEQPFQQKSSLFQQQNQFSSENEEILGDGSAEETPEESTSIHLPTMHPVSQQLQQTALHPQNQAQQPSQQVFQQPQMQYHPRPQPPQLQPAPPSYYQPTENPKDSLGTKMKGNVKVTILIVVLIVLVILLSLALIFRDTISGWFA